MHTYKKMHTRQSSHSGRNRSDELAAQATKSLRNSGSQIQRILEPFRYRNPPAVSEVSNLLKELGIGWDNPYRRVLYQALGRGFPHKLSIHYAKERAKNSPIFCNYTLIMSAEEWQVLEYTFSWLAVYELRTNARIAPVYHYQLAADVCMQSGEIRQVSCTPWDWWIEDYGFVHIAWLFDDPNSIESRLITDPIDRRQWRDAIGQIVLKYGGDLNCERLKRGL